MPLYEYHCRSGHRFSRFDSVSNHQSLRLCPTCFAASRQVITAPILVKAAADVCYDSPIDGSHITSRDKRNEDLKRNGCREYDPGMKTDYHRNLKDSESALDKAVDASVEAAIEKMPSAKRGKLFSELMEQGASANIIRMTPHV